MFQTNNNLSIIVQMRRARQDVGWPDVGGIKSMADESECTQSWRVRNSTAGTTMKVPATMPNTARLTRP
jgi:hypothetical protein